MAKSKWLKGFGKKSKPPTKTTGEQVLDDELRKKLGHTKFMKMAKTAAITVAVLAVGSALAIFDALRDMQPAKR